MSQSSLNNTDRKIFSGIQNHFKKARMAIAVLALATAAGAAGVTMSDDVVPAVALNPVMMMNKYPTAGYSAIWGYTAPNGREYALLGVRTGTSIVDITDAEPKEVAFIPGPTSIWRELKAYSHYAYVVTDNANSGIQIIDLSDLPNSAKLVKADTTLQQNHTIWIDDARKILYVMGGTGNAVTAFSLEDPVNLKKLSSFGTTYVHDMYAMGNRAYLSEILSKSWSIYDITDIAAPKLIKRVRDESAPRVSFHNSWPTADGKYMVTTEETDGRTVKIWDISNELDPKLVSEWLGPGKLAHNVQIKGRYAYFSHYGGGMRVVDLIDPLKPVEVAFWQRSKVGEEESGFVSAWGAYPLFKSGKVAISDMQLGLVVVQFEGGRE